jgi:hypothetical protein
MYAEEAKPDDDDQGFMRFSGEFGFEIGKIEKARYFSNRTVEDIWLDNMGGRLGMLNQPNHWLTMLLHLEGRMWFNTFPPRTQSDQTIGVDPYWSFYVHQAVGIVSLHKAAPALLPEPHALDLGFGYFEYKYNPQAMVLGEYLFRTGTYPAFIVNRFDMPFARLSGIRFTYNYANDLFNLKFEPMVLSEREFRPHHNITLAGLVDLNIMKYLEVGVGVSFAHAISVDDSMTTPKSSFNISSIDTVIGADTSMDTSYYTFKGTKLMGRATVDPFAGIRSNGGLLSDIVGKYGGKIYGEAAILGVKDYPASDFNRWGYDTLMHKMPMMAGVTIPFWKIFEVVAFEVEYFGSTHPNDYKLVYFMGVPLPNESYAYTDTTNIYGTKDNWKWALTVKKFVSKNFHIQFQASRDHQRWEVGPFKNNYDFEEMYVKPDEWSWHLKTKFLF